MNDIPKSNQPTDNELGDTVDVAEMLLKGVLKSYVVTGFTHKGEAIQLYNAESDSDKNALFTAIGILSDTCADKLNLFVDVFHADDSATNMEDDDDVEEQSWDDNSDEETSY